MWQSIAEQVSRTLDTPFIIHERMALSKEPDARRMVISDGQLQLFVKLAPRAQLEQQEAEFHSLQALRQYEVLSLPRPLCCGTAGEHAFLALEYHPLHEGDSAEWAELGASLARLHRCDEQAMYGWDEDNFLTTTPQPNRWHKQWAPFFAEQRIGWLLQLLGEKERFQCDIDGIVEIVTRRLAHHHPKPSPLHGELWLGNVGFTRNGGMVFDPASYYGDRETDLAMTELFGRFPEAFYQGYDTVWPRDAGYESRKELYNLYHRLNHFAQFGESHRHQAETALQQLLAC